MLCCGALPAGGRGIRLHGGCQCGTRASALGCNVHGWCKSSRRGEVERLIRLAYEHDHFASSRRADRVFMICCCTLLCFAMLRLRSYWVAPKARSAAHFHYCWHCWRWRRHLVCYHLPRHNACRLSRGPPRMAPWHIQMFVDADLSQIYLPARRPWPTCCAVRLVRLVTTASHGAPGGAQPGHLLQGRCVIGSLVCSVARWPAWSVGLVWLAGRCWFVAAHVQGVA